MLALAVLSHMHWPCWLYWIGLRSVILLHHCWRKGLSWDRKGIAGRLILWLNIGYSRASMLEYSDCDFRAAQAQEKG